MRNDCSSREQAEGCWKIVLRSTPRFRILRHEYHEWKHESISEIVEVCVIIHNMLLHLRLNGLPQEERNETGNLMAPTQVIEEFEQKTSNEVSDVQFQDHFE